MERGLDEPRERPLVMVVEDAADAREILVELLEHHGFDVVAVRNGAEALLRAHTLVPDLVLLDLSLPVLDGWAVARALRSEKRTQSIPILALTAHATLPELERARAAGCTRVFVKPAPHDELLMEMRRMIGRAKHASRPFPVGAGSAGVRTIRRPR